jgi:protein-tyrosine phosphatase
MTSILVVCTGNICRSPIAEGFLRDGLARRFGERSPVVSSAGTSGWEGSGAMSESVEAAAERGSDLSGHVARALTATMVQGADLVVCMATDHREQVCALVPDAEGRTFTLKELTRLAEHDPAGEPLGADELGARLATVDSMRRDGFVGNRHDEDIADPLGLPIESYRAVAWELGEWIDRLVPALFGPPAEGSMSEADDTAARGAARSSAEEA